MKHVLQRKLRQTKARVRKYRKQGYTEEARAEKRNVQAIMRQLAILESVK